MQAADEALYAAKQRGRNRVVLADATTRKSSDNNDHSGGRPA
jgi:predicted signal transduction protein with EAL and GGDEF domain